MEVAIDSMHWKISFPPQKWGLGGNPKTFDVNSNVIPYFKDIDKRIR